MSFIDYQAKAYRFAAYPRELDLTYTGVDEHGVFEDVSTLPYIYPALALGEEAGEVLGKIAKYIRKNEQTTAAYDKLRSDVSKELGDVLWQVAALATEFNLQLDEIAEENLAKLEDRKARDVIVGEGDAR